MADNVIVSNAPTSVNTDIPVRTIEKSTKQTQVVVIDYGGSGAESLTTPNFATEATLQTIATANTTSVDIMGVGVNGSRNNQIEISFDTSFDTAVITNATTSTGSTTISNGHALYATGAGVTATATGTSVGSVTYRPAHEQYSYFSAAFTTPTSANSNQRIGIYDANNGFFIGYQGTTFGVTKRTATVDTFTARTSWNGDLLNGSVGSQFTRNGTPEAINLSFSNLFRIRFAWLGSGSILFDVFSPDGKWINFHNIRQPNLALNPSINSPNLPLKVEALKSGADATNLIIYTACWAGGTTSDYSKITDTLSDNSLASFSRAVIAGRSSTGGGTYYNVKVTPSGSLTTAIGDISGIIGQNTTDNSIPVTIASDQTAVPINDNGSSITVDGTVAATQSGVWNLTNISGTVSLPTGAATETTLAAINTKTPSLGQTTMASSVPVTIASNQSAVSVTHTSASGAAPTFATVGTSSASVGLAIATYWKLVFCNTSINTIALGFDNAAVASRGIVLAPGEKIVLDGPIKITTAVNAIASAASSNLAIQAFTS